jgi:hypothetical protein
MGEDLRAIPVQEVRRSTPLRVIVYDEIPEAQGDDEDLWKRHGAEPGKMDVDTRELECRFIAPIESKRCADDPGKGATGHSGEHPQGHP